MIRKLKFIVIIAISIGMLSFSAIGLCNPLDTSEEIQPYVLLSPDTAKYDDLEHLYAGLDDVLVWPTRSFYADPAHNGGLLNIDLGDIVRTQVGEHTEALVSVVRDRKDHMFNWPEFLQGNTLLVWVDLSLENNIASISLRMFRAGLKAESTLENHCFRPFLILKEDELAEKIKKQIQDCTSRAYYYKDGVTDPNMSRIVRTDKFYKNSKP